MTPPPPLPWYPCYKNEAIFVTLVLVTIGCSYALLFPHPRTADDPLFVAAMNALVGFCIWVQPTRSGRAEGPKS